ncbi:hypothetical protein [Streptacidiphilus sp. EB103A]|uniref:hypothetical protein n=1 Tax=Streptacidiphilus sp. EB103A TaxID=3156275 RepID=UPI0035159B93
MRNDETGKVILVTGASGGIGALSVRALALAGHTVYAGIRQIATRPLRTHIDPSRDGSEVASAVTDRLRADFFRRIGLDSLLTAGSSL